MEGDKGFLVDVVGVIKDTAPLRNYVTDNNEDKILKKFSITDGRYYIKVTLFDELAKSFEESYDKQVGDSIIVLASAKVGRFQGEVTLTNYPATRFYLNMNHHAVNKLRIRFQVCTLCTDSTGVVPIILEDREVRRLSGKTVFELKLDQASETDDEKFPPVLNQIANKDYTITLIISQDNVCNSYNVYTADDIAEGHELFQSNIPLNQTSGETAEFPNSTGTGVFTKSPDETPNTKNSSTKNRVRKSPEGVSIVPMKLKNVKVEKETKKSKINLKKKVIKIKSNKSSEKAPVEEINESEDYDSEEHVPLQNCFKIKNKKI